VFPPEVYTASFGGDVKPSVSGDLVKIGSCLLQALVSHYCDKPLRGNSTSKIKIKKPIHRTAKEFAVDRKRV